MEETKPEMKQNAPIQDEQNLQEQLGLFELLIPAAPTKLLGPPQRS